MHALQRQATRDFRIYDHRIACIRMYSSDEMSEAVRRRNHYYARNFFQNPFGLRWYKV